MFESGNQNVDGQTDRHQSNRRVGYMQPAQIAQVRNGQPLTVKFCFSRRSVTSIPTNLQSTHTYTIFSCLKSIIPSLIKSSSLTLENHLFVTSTRSKKIGRCCFVFAVPVEWNKLPRIVMRKHTVSGFRNHLETHFYKRRHVPFLSTPLLRCYFGNKPTS